MTTAPARINVLIIGYGNVGQKVSQLLLERRAHYRQRGFDLRIVGVCNSSGGVIDANGLTQAHMEERSRRVPGVTGRRLIEGVAADVVFEATPTDFRTGGAALHHIRAALRHHMDVIAISKGALALDYAGLHAEAAKRRVVLKLSAATGSAIPTIDLLQYNLAGCRIHSLTAIVTGTTNIILSEMMDKECSFQAAVAEAQRLGVAESDPTLDTHGWDTACKMAILCNAAFGTRIDVRAMPRQGIEHVTLADVQRWKAAGVMPRLVGRITPAGDSYEASVGIELYGPDHPFARAHGPTKAVHVVTDLMGELTLVGGGSSPYGTAAAALKDLEHVLTLRRPVM